MKENIMIFLEVVKGLIKYPVIFVLAVLAFALNIAQEILGTNGWIQCTQLIGLIILTAFFAVILITNKDGKKYINKVGLFSFFWLVSCVVLIDFSDFGLETLARLVAAYEFIFLGCLIPDFVSQVEREQDDTIRNLEERISKLEESK